MWPCESITIILWTVCICYEGLVFICSCRVLANVHELRHRRLLNSWFRKLFVNSLIDCRSVGIRFCARPTALIIYRWRTLFLLTLQQLLHKLVVLIDRERLATLAMSCLHLLVDTWLALDHTLRVIMVRPTCFKRSRFPCFSICSFTIYWIVWLVLVGGKIRWRCFLHLVYWTVRLLPIVLCCEMRSYGSLVMMHCCFLINILACCRFMSILCKVCLQPHLVSINCNIKHGVSVVLMLWIVLEMGVLKMLHLLLLHHLLLLILTEAIELVMLHHLFLLHGHLVFIWVSEEVILLYVMLLLILHTWRGLILSIDLLYSIVQTVEILLWNRIRVLIDCFGFGWLYKDKYELVFGQWSFKLTFWMVLAWLDEAFLCLSACYWLYCCD